MSTNSSLKFSTPEEAELARQLGFVPPQNPVPDLPKGKTTNVVGYFNANPWPVHIFISAVGISLRIPNRGEFVRDVNGNKINDPILEQYVGPGQLSRETSQTPVPLRLFARPEQLPPTPASQSSIHQASAFVQTPQGVKPIILDKSDEMPQLPENHASCIGMTMDQARRLKLVRPMIDPRENAPKDTDGQPAPGETLPTLEDATPRDMKPGEYQRWIAEQRAKGAALKSPPGLVPVEVARPAANMVREPEENLPPQDDELDRPTAETDEIEVPPVAEPENPGQVELQSTLVAAASDKTVIHDAVAAALGTQPRVATPVALQPASLDPAANLPRPVLEAPEATPPAQRAKFVCLVDGKRFDYRSQLEAYAKRKHPDRVAEIMAPYPKVR